jgi:hypothetical protein
VDVEALPSFAAVAVVVVLDFGGLPFSGKLFDRLGCIDGGCCDCCDLRFNSISCVLLFILTRKYQIS